MAGSKPKKQRILADFDMYDREALEKALENRLKEGYKLTRAAQTFGVMTFEPALPEEKVTYAVIRPTEYENGGALPAPWKKCGRIGVYIIYRSSGAAYVPKPDRDAVECDRKQRKTFIIIGVLWLLMSLCYFAVDIPAMFGSARGFSEKLDFTILRDIMALICGIGNLGSGLFRGKARSAKRGRGEYFRQYILPWIIIIVILVPAGLGIAYDAGSNKEIPLPAGLPFSEASDQCTFDRSYTAERYSYYDPRKETSYRSCFLYEAKVPGLAEKLFAEMRDDPVSDHYSSYPIPDRFISCDFEEHSTEGYSHLDEILFCKEYEGGSGNIFKGIIVRSESRIFGIGYVKDDHDDDEILRYLDEYFAGA